jgi:ferric iron reductase protein FhuF
VADGLMEHEIALLKAFRFALHADSSAFSFEAADLLKADKRYGILLAIKERLNSPDLQIAASMLMKRYGFFAAINMYAMSVLNKRLPCSIGNIIFQESEKTGWIPNILYKDTSAAALRTDREEKREEILRGIFAEHMYPVMEVLSRETGLSKLIMWENIAIYLFWLYENLFEQFKGRKEAEWIHSDFQYLIVGAPGSIFGNLHANPLQRFYTEKVLLPEHGNSVRVRKTCCFSYKLGTKNAVCHGCPRTCKVKG